MMRVGAQQRLIRQGRLPLRLLVVTLLVALLWFIVMFLYVDDLLSDDQTSGRGARRHQTGTQHRKIVIRKQGAPPDTANIAAASSSSNDMLLIHDNGEAMLVYDHDTGRRLEVERVEDEYVEIWEHGKWVRVTDIGHKSRDGTPIITSSPLVTSLPDTSTLLPSPPLKSLKVLSPYSRVRGSKLPAGDASVHLVKHRITNNNNNMMSHRVDADFILLEEDSTTPKDVNGGKQNVSYNTNRSHVMPEVMSISPEHSVTETGHPHFGTRKATGTAGDDFHFATKESVLTATNTPFKFQSHSLFSRVTHTKSSTVDNPPLSFQPTSPVTAIRDRLSSEPTSVPTPATSPLPVVKRVKTSGHFPHPKGAHYSLVEPRQLPVPVKQRSGGSRRGSSNAASRRNGNKHGRRHYIEKPHVNINAKAGTRINYVNINKNTGTNGYKTNMGEWKWNSSNISVLHGNSTKSVKLKWTQSQQSVQTNASAYPQNVSADHNRTAPATEPGVLYYSQSLREAAAHQTQSLDFLEDLEDGYGRHSFNVSASNSVPLIRDLPETRPKSCLLSPPSLPVGAVLPLATVVICFHNEAWATLLRTIHSVLSRSPAHLLKEIILVDDYSSYDYLGAQLETYIANFPQIQLVRTHKREGLIRARLLGVSYARGDVLVFLDSHCECNRQWLEPLLYAIIQDRSKIACPQIDIINPDNFVYERAPLNLHGGFNWRLQFVWKEIPDHQGAIRVSEKDPIRTPTMIGGLFAVNRRYFLDVGAYDSGMNIWGSENLELSFRVWMCGGSIDILPCSRVGHLFRPIIPYGFPDGARATLHNNAMRVTEVWMDQYKKFYYASQDMRRDPAVLASLSERHRLRQSLACNDFNWYLKNIVPEMDIPPLNGKYYGQVRNKEENTCLYSVDNNYNKTLFMANCQHQLYRQQFAITTGGELVHYFQCIYVQDNIPVLSPCGKVSLVWSVTKEGQVVASDLKKSVSLCLDVKGVSVVMATCDANKMSQVWSFTYHFDIDKLNIKY